METLQKINNHVKEDMETIIKYNEHYSSEKSCYFFYSIMLISILNFSIPIITSDFNYCSSFLINFYETIKTTLFINFDGGNPLSPENFVVNGM